MKPALTLITLCLTLFGSLLALNAHAAPGRGHGHGWRSPRGPIKPPPPPPSYSRPGYHSPGRYTPAPYPGYAAPIVTCSASDNGWEEHLFGHGSCGECLAKHGKCTERCSQTSYSCRAEGTGYSGLREHFDSYSGQEHLARSEALNHCYHRGLSGCTVSCSSSQQLVSTRSCR